MAHLCLYKIYEDDIENASKTSKALIRMAKNIQGKLKITSHEFEIARRIHHNFMKSDEGRKLTSKLTKAAMATLPPEKKQKMVHKISQSQIGSKWWTNGSEDHFCKDCPGDGWIRGRSNFKPNPFQIRRGKDHPMFGKKHSKESIEKMRLAQLGKHPTEETRKKLSLKLLGNTHLLGYKFSEESKKLISERERSLNLHWFTDGVNNVKTQICPQGFRKGRTCSWCKKEVK